MGVYLKNSDIRKLYSTGGTLSNIGGIVSKLKSPYAKILGGAMSLPETISAKDDAYGQQIEEQRKLLLDKDIERSQQRQNQVYAQGGLLNNQVNEFNGGGTHEQNPNGGINVGGNNYVESGETTGIRDTKDYVFSDRLKLKAIDKTFAEISKDIEKKYKGYDNDRIALQSKERELNELRNQQEIVKTQQFIKQLTKLQKNNPEQFAAMQQQMQQNQEQNNTQQQQVPQIPQEQQVPQMQQQQFAYGGNYPNEPEVILTDINNFTNPSPGGLYNDGQDNPYAIPSYINQDMFNGRYLNNNNNNTLTTVKSPNINNNNYNNNNTPTPNSNGVTRPIVTSNFSTYTRNSNINLTDQIPLRYNVDGSAWRNSPNYSYDNEYVKNRITDIVGDSDLAIKMTDADGGLNNFYSYLLQNNLIASEDIQMIKDNDFGKVHDKYLTKELLGTYIQNNGNTGNPPVNTTVTPTTVTEPVVTRGTNTPNVVTTQNLPITRSTNVTADDGSIYDNYADVGNTPIGTLNTLQDNLSSGEEAGDLSELHDGEINWVEVGASAIPNLIQAWGNNRLANKLKYPRARAYNYQPDYVDPTRAAQEANTAYANFKDKTRQVSSGAGNYMSNLIGATAGEAKQLSNVYSQYANINAGISNQAGQFNASQNQDVSKLNAQIGMQQEQDKVGLKQNALNNLAGALNTGFKTYEAQKRANEQMVMAGGENFSYKYVGPSWNQKMVKVFEGEDYKYYTDPNTGKDIYEYGGPNEKKIALEKKEKLDREYQNNYTVSKARAEYKKATDKDLPASETKESLAPFFINGQWDFNNWDANKYNN